MRPFAEDIGFHGAPFPWDEERRFQLRAKIDAAFFHRYPPASADGAWKRHPAETDREYQALVSAFPTPRDAVSHVMETFPIVRDKDMKGWGRYRTREAILARYDEMMETMGRRK